MPINERFPVHPAASVFPLMSDAEFDQLKADIAANGQQQPIVYWQGELIDGRHRLRACEELDVEPKTDELDEWSDPVAYIVSANLHRRHLTTAQRSMVAAKMATLKRGGDQRSDTIKGQICPLIADAAKMLSVSERSVKSAKHVSANGSKALIDAVERGEMNLHQATTLVQAVPDKRQQAKIVRGGKEAIKAAVAQNAPNGKAELKGQICPFIAAADEYRRDINALIKKIKDAPKLPGLELLAASRNGILLDLANAKSRIVACIPYRVCPYCRGVDSECVACKGRGYLNKIDFQVAPKEMRDAVEKLPIGGGR